MDVLFSLMDSVLLFQVFEGTNAMSLTNTKTRFTGKPMELALSKELLGRVFSGGLEKQLTDCRKFMPKSVRISMDSH